MTTAIGLVLSAAAIADERDSGIPVIEWHTALSKFRVDNDDFVGQRFTLPCPERMVRDRKVVLSGTDTYTSDSALCFAAVHAGVMGGFYRATKPGC